MPDALEVAPADCWRWYLMSNAPESDDASFTWELFGEAVNKDLVGTLGNFVNRTATQVTRHFGSSVPEGGEPGVEEAELAGRIDARLADYLAAMDGLEFRKATAALRALWVEGNVYLETREPWKTVKDDRDRTACTLRTALGLAVLYGTLSAPFVPEAAAKLLGAFPGVDAATFVVTPDLRENAADAVAPGAPFVAPDLLFAKLAPEDLAAAPRSVRRRRSGGGVMSWIDSLGKRVGLQGARVLMLVALIGVSGVIIGLAVAYPLRYVNFEDSDAKRLDQQSLAGQIDPKSAVVTVDDLPSGWTPGDPAVAGYGPLGQPFCGEDVPVPTPLSGVEAAVFTNPTDRATVISQAQRLDRVQSARDYLDDVATALDECDEFFRGDPPTRVKVQSSGSTAPIAEPDYVSRLYVADDGVQQWSMMLVGDVVIVTSYNAPSRPAGNFLNDVENHVLRRIDPGDFAVGGITESTETTETTGSTVAPAAGGDPATTAPNTTGG